ncbi:MAG: ComF family protein, partial [Kiritimatiellae bacterium]|nr:ComF family protein [Kiritimatiellia bacterium]
ELARRIDRRLAKGVVVRTGSPRRQSSLDEDARRENVKGTFAVRRPELVRGRTLLVVDDILTTGATLGECAKTLAAAGAWRVWGATLARSVRS